MAHVFKDGTATFRPHLQQHNLLSPVAMTALTKSHLRLFKQIELVNRVWLGSVEAARQSERELGRRLLERTDPNDAVAVCREWTSRRVVNFVADNHRITKLWLDFAQAIESAAEDDG